MKKIDKKLLLKDLCARLPYGVKVEHLLHSPNNPSELFGVDVDKQILYCDHKGREEWYKVDFIKPYLRPMSSMTEEEKVEFCDLQDKFLLSSQYPVTCGYALFDWLDKNMFDYRGLIEKNIALDCTGLHIYD